MKNDFYFYNDSLNEPIIKNNPLTYIPKPEKTLYCVNQKYFDTEEELNYYCKEQDISINNTFKMDYIRNMANQNDVIRKTNSNEESIYMTVIDEDGYAIYNEEKSINQNEFVWDFEYGNLRWEYDAFRENNILFEDDIYKRIDEINEEYLSNTRILKKVI